MKKILILGNFCFGSQSYNGHTAKSRDYYYYLVQRYGVENVDAIDTASFRKNFISAYIKLKKSLKNTENVVMLVGANAAKILVPIVVNCKNKFGYKVWWSLVGGGLLYDEKTQKKLKFEFSGIDALFCETKALTEYFSSFTPKVYYTPVFTRRKLNKPFEPIINHGKFKFCTYSRVCKEKGISIAIEAIKEINKNGVRCTLDIFGTPDQSYVKELSEITNGTQSYIKFNDYLSGDGVIDKLNEFDAMLFPTYYSGEGFPIGIIECFTAGIPVIASDWHYNAEIVQNGKTGFIFDLNNNKEFLDKIEFLLQDRESALSLRINAREYSSEFEPERVLESLFREIDSNQKKI